MQPLSRSLWYASWKKYITVVVVVVTNIRYAATGWQFCFNLILKNLYRNNHASFIKPIQCPRTDFYLLLSSLITSPVKVKIDQQKLGIYAQGQISHNDGLSSISAGVKLQFLVWDSWTPFQPFWGTKILRPLFNSNQPPKPPKKTPQAPESKSDFGLFCVFFYIFMSFSHNNGPFLSNSFRAKKTQSN